MVIPVVYFIQESGAVHFVFCSRDCWMTTENWTR